MRSVAGAVPLLLALGLGASAEAPLVREVVLDGDAATRARLSRYLQVAVGEPLSGSQVAETVRLLFATGDFEDVLAETEAIEGGLRVVFRPLPAPRMKAFVVRGHRVMSDRELRQATRLRWDEPLWEARLEEAGRDAGLALAARGYLEARAVVGVSRAEAGATAVCEVSAGPLALVDSVAVEGGPPEAAASLRSLARPRPRAVWRRALAEQAAEAMRKELHALGRWRAEVTVREAYDPSRGRVALRFVVDAGPRLAVAVRGSPLPASLRRRVEQLVREGQAREDSLEEALDVLEQELRARGHREAVVTRSESGGAERREIVYQVESGPPAQVLSLRVAGVDAAMPEPRFETRVGEPLVDDRLERDAATLTQALRDQGYSLARVEVEAAEGGGPIPVVLRARPGPLGRLESVTIAGPAPAEHGVEAPALSTKAGQPYRVREVAIDRAALAAAWREAGFLQSEVVPEIETSEDGTRVGVVFRVRAGPRTTVGEIVVAGIERTRERVVRRELGIASGDPFSLSRILDAQRRLQALGLFERVDAREILGESESVRPVVIALQEAPGAAVSYGLGYAERDLLRGSVEVTLRNLYGLDRSLSSFARISFRGSRLVATYREPRFFGRKQELFLTAFREEQDRDSFDYVRYGGLAQTARPLAGRLTLIGRLTYQRTQVFNVAVPLDEIDREFRGSTFAGPSASLILDNRNDPLDPTRGHFLGADLEVSHRLLGGDSFVKGFVQGAGYAPLLPRLVLALSGRLGAARTFSGAPPRLPLPDRFFAGGDYSLRGFPIDGVNREGGNGLLLAVAELRFAARPRFELAAFSDAGNVYPRVADWTLRELRYTAGLGLRYKSTIGPLRLDWGYKLNRRPGESAYQVHVTVGHAF